MSGEQLQIVKAASLASGIDPDVLTCLLLLKYISEPAGAEPCWRSVISCSGAETLWDGIVQETYEVFGDLLSAVRYAAAQISPGLPFAAKAAERLYTESVDERALRGIVRRLADIETDAGTLSAFFQDDWAQKLRACGPDSGDFYTPEELIRLMTELLGMEHGGKVYDPCCGSGALLCGAARF